MIDAHPDQVDYLVDKPRDIDNIEHGWKETKGSSYVSLEHDMATLTVVDKNKKPLAMFYVGEDDVLYDDAVPKEFAGCSKRSRKTLEALDRRACNHRRLRRKFCTLSQSTCCPLARWLGASFFHQFTIKENSLPIYLINKDVIDEYYV